MSKISEQQDLFCREFLIDMNQTKAAERAGYSEDSARSQGSKLMAQPAIQARIRDLNMSRVARLELTADKILTELYLIGTSDIGEAFNEKGDLKPIKDMPENLRRAISGVEIEALFDGYGAERGQIGHTKKLKLWEKTKALELLGKHLKLFVDKHEHSFPDLANRIARGRQRVAELQAEQNKGGSNGSQEESEEEGS